MEIVTSLMERGIEQGSILGKLELIVRLINRKIGKIAPQLMERIRQLSEPKLGDLFEALLDFSNEENLEEWLQQNTEDSTSDESSSS